MDSKSHSEDASVEKRIAQLEFTGRLNLYVAPVVFSLVALISAYFVILWLFSQEPIDPRAVPASISIIAVIVAIFLVRAKGKSQLEEAKEMRKKRHYGDGR